MEIPLQELEASAPTEPANAVEANPEPPLPAPERIALHTDLKPILAAWLALSDDAQSSIVNRFERLLESGSLAFQDHCLGEAGAVVVPDVGDGHEFWFVGDTHGDLLALEASLLVASSRPGPYTIVWLGDLIDDGFHSHHALLRLYDEVTRRPGDFVFLAGNHDEALSWVEDAPGGGRFASRVEPADYSRYLNAQIEQDAPGADLSTRAGRAFVRFVAGMPRALFLPGLFASHGGFPHSDLWERLSAPEDLVSNDALQDYAWNRLAKSRLKIPARAYTTQSEFGAEDLFGFLERASGILDMPLHAHVRGHDHCTGHDRFDRPEEVRRASYAGRSLTLNNLSFTMRREFYSEGGPGAPRAPTLARWRAGVDRWPTPVVLDLPEALVRWYSNPCPRCGNPNPTLAKHCDASVRRDGKVQTCGGELCG